MTLLERAFKKANKYQNEYQSALTEMMFMTSHKVRKAIVTILGLSGLLYLSTNSPIDLKKIINKIRESALSLDTTTKELTTFIFNLQQKFKK
jgi:hypothetical protein